MTNSFESHFTEQALESEFAILCQRKFDYIESCTRISAGHDGVDYSAFEENKEQRIRSISRQVISDDVTQCRYTFSPFLERIIPKPNSTKTRTISIGTISDALVQQAIAKYIEPSIEGVLPQHVYAYRKGRSARQAARHVFRSITSGNRFVFEADIKEFFDTLDRSLLIGMISSLRIDDRAKTLVRRFLYSRRVIHEDRTAKKPNDAYRLTNRVAGVPQGGVLSGMLANLYLSKLDAAMCEFPGYARYADDFVVCCPSAREAERAKDIANSTLESLHLQLHPEKSIIANDVAASPVKFLGFSICTAHIRIHPLNIEKFKSVVQAVLNDHIVGNHPVYSLQRLLRSLRYKLCGPQMDELLVVSPGSNSPLLYRRCWIGYFRCATDIEQLKSLDRFILQRISHFAYSIYRMRLKRKQIRTWGLPSLVSTLYNTRRGISVRVVGGK